jgi:hypothetical protein
MARNTFNILFYVKKTRIAKNGEVPVMLRITANGLRAETSVNLKVNPKFWNVIAGKSIGDTRKDYELNSRIRISKTERRIESKNNQRHSDCAKNGLEIRGEKQTF